MLIVDGAAKKWFGCVSTGGGAGEGRAIKDKRAGKKGICAVK